MTKKFKNTEIDLLQEAREEILIAKAQGLIVEAMKREGVTQKLLARRLNVTEAAVSQLIGGSPNLTMRRFARVLASLGDEAVLSTRNQQAQEGKSRSERQADRASWEVLPFDSTGLMDHVRHHANENDQARSQFGVLECGPRRRSVPNWSKAMIS